MAELKTSIVLNSSTVLSESGGTVSWGTGVPAGSVINVQQALKTDVQTITNSSTFPDWEDITGLSITMTPKSASSKFFIQSCVMCSGQYWKVYVNLVRVVGGVSTELQLGDARGTYRPRYRSGVLDNTFQDTHGPMQYIPHLIIDSPNTTSDVTYKLQGSGRNLSENIMYINRSVPDRDNSSGEYDSNGSSSIVIMEIAG